MPACCGLNGMHRWKVWRPVDERAARQRVRTGPWCAVRLYLFGCAVLAGVVGTDLGGFPVLLCGAFLAFGGRLGIKPVLDRLTFRQ